MTLFKEIYNRVLLGLAVTALVTVVSGAAGSFSPLSEKMTEVSANQITKSPLFFKLAPQCKIISKIPGFPRCESPRAQARDNNSSERLH